MKSRDSRKLMEFEIDRISFIRVCRMIYCYLEKLVFCQKILDMMIDEEVEIDLSREFLFVNELFLFEKTELLEL